MNPTPANRQPPKPNQPDDKQRTIEVPGRPDADLEKQRKPAYGPGGADPVADEERPGDPAGRTAASDPVDDDAPPREEGERL